MRTDCRSGGGEAVKPLGTGMFGRFSSAGNRVAALHLKAYGFTDNALELMTAYLLGRRQRVKLDGVFIYLFLINYLFIYLFIYNNFICNNQYKKAAIREEPNPHVR